MLKRFAVSILAIIALISMTSSAALAKRPKGYLDTIEECEEFAANLMDDPDITYDSDRDGVPDMIELSISFDNLRWKFDPRHADCHRPVDESLSIWFLPDSDMDGIIDSRDRYPDWKRVYDLFIEGQPLPIYFRAEGIEVRDSDKDRIYDVMERDSDDDGIDDGEEDRPAYIDRDAPAYLHYVGIAGDTYVKSSRGERIRCDDMSDMFYDSFLGVSYELFEMGGDHELPSVFDYDTGEIEDDRVLLLLSCKSESASSPSSFNGKFDTGNFETDPTLTDTDGDGYSDLEDNCPRVGNPSQRDSNRDGVGDECSFIFKRPIFQLHPSAMPRIRTVVFGEK